MRDRVKRFTVAGVALVALTVPVALSSAGTPSTVKVPLERDATCDEFTGKRSVVGSATITRLKNGDVQFTVTVRNKATPGASITLYPFQSASGCNYYPYLKMKLDSGGVGTKTFTLTGVSGDTDLGTEALNDTTGVYDVTPTVHI
jgi:hypothetical protein